MTPAVPEFATISSIFVAYRRSGAIHIHNAEMPNNMPWPRDARLLSKRLGGSITAWRLIEKHSMVPLYGALCLTVAPAELIDARASRRRASSHSPLLGTFSSGIHGAMRRCPECTRGDLRDFGFAHWYVHHQVRQVRHCLKHRCALESACARCEKPFVSTLTWQGADEGCDRCGPEAGLPSAKDQFPIAEGYWNFILAIERCLQGGRDIVVRQPLQRINAYRKHETTAQTHTRIDALLGYFGARSDEEFAKILCFDFSREDLFTLFRAADGVTEVSRRTSYTPLWLAMCTYGHFEKQEIERDAELRLAEARNDLGWDYLDLT